MQVSVGTLRAHQFVVRPVLDDAAALDGDDSIGAAHGRQAVSDHEHGAALAYLLHVVLDDSLALIVERARRFVKDQDARVGDERASNCDALTLTTGQVAAALADERVVALGELQNEFMGPARDAAAMICSIDIAGFASAMLSRTERLNSMSSWSTTAELSPQPSWVHHRKIDAVDQDAPRFRHVEALDELGERALAGA
jgi:hypothetical protein